MDRWIYNLEKEMNIKLINKNYCCTVVKIDKTVPLENCDNVVAAIVSNYQVIVGKETQIGDIGIFFPIESQISPEFLSNNNLYREKSFNKDKSVAGYFEQNRRVKCVKFRGNRSEGFYIPLRSLEYIEPNYNELEIGTEFNELNGELICQKYIIPVNMPSMGGGKKGRQPKQVSRLVENQFRLHSDVSQLKKNMHNIMPDDLISVTNKLHGSSFVVSNILVKKPLNIFWKTLRFVGIPIIDTEYDIVYASRCVIKNAWFKGEQNHFYKYNLWEDIAKEVGPFIPKGITLYGECVGYVKSGGFIQKGYHYGCSFLNHKNYIYRITSTNLDGQVIEYSWPQIKEFCKRNDLNCVPEFYYGYAKDLFDIPVDGEWHTTFLSKLDVYFNINRMCEMNNYEVPAEGLVVKVDRLYEYFAFKYKNISFMERETKLLDVGVSDTDVENQEEVAPAQS